MPITVRDFASFKDFLEELRKQRAKIRAVRLLDHGLVEPAKRHDAWVMQPMVRLVVTAFDRDTEEILRYTEQRDANGTVTIVVGTAYGRHNERQLISRREEIRAILVDEGFQVEEGEWTPSIAAAFLQARQRALG